MRKLLHLTGFCTLLFGLAAVSCKPEVVPETLDTPSNLASSAVTSTGATLTWAAVEGAESYLVRIADGTPVSATSTTYTASGLTPETSYTWAVQAVKGDLKSDWSSNATFTTAAPPVVPVPVPTGLTSDDVTHESATLSWTAVEGASGYEVKIGDGTPVAVTETSYDAVDLTAETEYTWTVRATATGKEPSDWATNATFTTEAAPVIPLPVPADLVASNITHESATLAWSAVEGASGYEVKIGDGTPVAVTATTYAATGLTAETAYTWTVRATAEGKDPSDWAANANFTTEAAPAVSLTAPTGLEAKDVTTNSANLNWTAVEGATGYEVKINDGASVAVTGTTYAATGLVDGTQYSWAVRAVAAGSQSEWATAKFSIVTFNGFYPLMGTTDNAILMDKNYGPGTNVIVTNFVNFDPNDDIDDVGFDFMFEFVTGILDLDSSKQYIDIPAGTYTVSETPAANTIPTVSDYTLLMLSDFSWFTLPSSGTMTVSGDHSNYNFSFNLGLADGSQFFARYSGPLALTNPNWVDPNGDPRLGTFTGSGTPSWYTTPGPGTWTGGIYENVNNDPSYLIAENPIANNNDFGAFLNLIDGKMYLDTGEPIASGTLEGGIEVEVYPTIMYTDAEGTWRLPIIEEMDVFEIFWDPATRTFDLLELYDVGIPLMYGYGAYHATTGEYVGNLSSDFYTYVSWTLTSSSGLAKQSGTPSKMKNISVNKNKNTLKAKTAKLSSVKVDNIKTVDIENVKLKLTK